MPGRSSWMRIPLTVSVHVEYLEPMKVCARAQSSCSMHREGRCKRACRCVRAGLPARCVCVCMLHACCVCVCRFVLHVRVGVHVHVRVPPTPHPPPPRTRLLDDR